MCQGKRPLKSKIQITVWWSHAYVFQRCGARVDNIVNMIALGRKNSRILSHQQIISYIYTLLYALQGCNRKKGNKLVWCSILSCISVSQCLIRPSCCRTVRIYWCRIVKIYWCTTIRIYWCRAIRIYWCKTVRICWCRIVSQSCCRTVRPSPCITERPSWCRRVRIYQCRTVRPYQCRRVRPSRCITAGYLRRVGPS